MQISEICKSLDQWKPTVPHNPSLPRVKKTSKPESNKVVGDPTRTPVDRQAALIISPCNSWLSKPLPPESLPTPESKETKRLNALLKIERNENAKLKDEIGNLRLKLNKCRFKIERLLAEIEKLKQLCQSQSETIHQLEDLRL